ncbi:MAG: methyltransferase domain-containing protein [Euryarchaeota archaeon]|nr:methyltransferase domain-containing protein [Euryarchaeota archaeon]
MRLLFHLSGEHPTLPHSEALALLRALHTEHHETSREGPLLQVDAERPPIPLLSSRLGLCHSIEETLLQGNGDPTGLLDALARAQFGPTRTLPLKTSSTAVGPHITLPPGTTFRIRGGSPHLVREAGELIRRRGHPVDLHHPHTTLHIRATGKGWLLTRELAATDRTGLEARRPKNRPFFTPGVLLPPLARALVNLAETPPGGLLLDPFTGTGSIPLEAALMGARPLAADLQLKMLLGTSRNLRHHQVEPEALWANATRLPLRDNTVDAVVADPPYGRSATLAGALKETLYQGALQETHRVLKPGRRAVFLFPQKDYPRIPGLPIEEEHRVPVHRSLTRWATAMRKE